MEVDLEVGIHPPPSMSSPGPRAVVRVHGGNRLLFEVGILVSGLGARGLYTTTPDSKHLTLCLIAFFLCFTFGFLLMIVSTLFPHILAVIPRSFYRLAVGVAFLLVYLSIAIPPFWKLLHAQLHKL